MSATLLEPPPRRARPSGTRSAAPPATPPRPRDRNVLPAALLLSVLFHFIVLVLFRFEVIGGGEPAPAPAAVREPEGTRIVQLRIVPDEEAPLGAEPLQPRAEGEFVPPALAPSGTPQGLDIRTAPEATGRDPLPPVAERISPRLGDRRLFAESPEALPPRPDPLTVARDRVADQLAAFNDSAAAAAAAADRATDWTVKDGNGGRWGVTPGKIHLGGLTLPLPVSFAPPPGRRDEFAERNRRWGDIESQRGNAATRATIDDRVKAMRQRSDAQRDSTRRSGSGGT